MPEIDYYTTSDIGLVGYLRTQIGDPQKVEWVVGTCKWSFIHTSGLQAIVESYYGDLAFVNPREMDRALKRTRDEFYEAKLAASQA